jgi:hypothetical protein
MLTFVCTGRFLSWESTAKINNLEITDMHILYPCILCFLTKPQTTSSCIFFAQSVSDKPHSNLSSAGFVRIRDFRCSRPQARVMC